MTIANQRPQSASPQPKEAKEDSQGPSRSAANVSQQSLPTTTDASDKKVPPLTNTTSDPQQWAQYSVSGPETTTANFLPQQYSFNPALGQDIGNPVMTTGPFSDSQTDFANLAPDFGFQMPFNAEGIFSGFLPDDVFDLPVDENMNFYLPQ